MARQKQNKRKHEAGVNKSSKKQKQENEHQWRNTRGDDPSNRFTLPMFNHRFNAFYRALGLFENDKEWNEFISALLTPLPACFHMNPDYPFTSALKSQLQQIMDDIKVASESSSTLNHEEIQGKDVVLETLPWYPENCGFKLGADRRVIRKDERLVNLHKWLVRHTENGNITRQEAVSMVPPLALDVHPHHKCIDMCAAPGSKTSQLLEIVNRSLNRPESEQGLIVANDADTSRAYMLVHQCRRINSPLLIVTTHQAQQFPFLSNPQDSSKAKEYEFFDRVLCDVPCSGDGTLRKNPEIWNKWSARNSIGLHVLQISIAMRGLALLKEGGLMVYSTCSMSPYEDEAVVAELLRQSNGTLELVDPRESVPLFRCRHGLSNWPVFDDAVGIAREKLSLKKTEANATKDSIEDSSRAPTEVDTIPPSTDPISICESLGMVFYPTYESQSSPETMTDGQTNRPGTSSRVKRSIFPPSTEESSWMHLERCMRCLPHDEDTGGFFVATFRKVASPRVENDVQPASSEIPLTVAVTNETNSESLSAQDPTIDQKSNTKVVGYDKSGSKGLSEFLSIDAEDFQKLKSFYQLDNEISANHLFFRKDNSRNKGEGGQLGRFIYFIGNSARTAMLADKKQRLKVVAAGIKVFERKGTAKDSSSAQPVEYRLVQEGIHLMAPHISGRKVVVTAQDFSNILGAGLVSFSTLDSNTVTAILQEPIGVVICIYKYSVLDQLSLPADEASIVRTPSDGHLFYALCFKGTSRVLNVICSKTDIETMKHQLEALNVLRPKIFAPTPQSSQALVPDQEENYALEANSEEMVEREEEALLDAEPDFLQIEEDDDVSITDS